jgi:hypothetical protein
MSILYTLHLHRIKHPENKIVIKHCYKDDDQIWYRPLCYRNGEVEHEKVIEPIEEQTGWDYEELDGMGYILDSYEEEK